MKRLALLSLLCIGIGAAAQAECYADYKAKRDNPLRLQYGVMQIDGACTLDNAARQARTRLARDDWTLLNVLSVFGRDGLAERKESAGPYFLRF